MGRYSLSYCLLVLAWLGASIKNVQAQDLPVAADAVPYKKVKRFSLGPRIEGNQMLLHVNGVVADKYQLYNGSEQYQGYRLGAFGRYDARRNYLQAEFSYFYNTAFVQFVNLNPDEDWIESPFSVWTYTGHINTYQRAEVALVAGRRLNKWLRVQAGPVLARQIQDDFFNEPDSYYNTGFRRQHRVLQDFEESYHRYLLSGKVGVGVALRNFTVDLGYETSLTPLGARIYYSNQGQSYPLKQSARQLTLGVGFKLVKF